MPNHEPDLEINEYIVLTDAPIQKIRNALINRGFRQDSIVPEWFLKGITLEASEIDKGNFNLEDYVAEQSSEPNYLDNPKAYVFSNLEMSMMEPDINNPLDDSLDLEDYKSLAKNEFKSLQKSLENEGYKTHFVGLDDSGFLSITE